MTDANQRWGVDEAITWMKQLAPLKPHWIEEPTSPTASMDEMAKVAAATTVPIATGENLQVSKISPA